MRIAVAGTHCSGKSTLVDDFLATNPEYVHEPEPYEWLEQLYGEPLSAEPDAAAFDRQLEVSVERLRTYRPGTDVIAERSPADFLAYLLALDDLGRGGPASGLTRSAAELARTGMEHIDLLVVLPLNGVDAIRVDAITPPNEEDLELRDAMNDRLLEILASDEYDLLRGGELRMVELHGTRSQRLAALYRAILRT